jgi:hypothetical protein
MQQMASDATLSALDLVPRLWDPSASPPQSIPACNGCAPSEYEILPRQSASAERSYIAVVATAGLPDLRPGGAPPYTASLLSWSTGSRTITGKLGSSSTGCTASVVHNPDTPSESYSCTQQSTYRSGYRALVRARIVIPSGSHLRLTPTSAPTPAIAPRPPTGLQVDPELTSFTWQTSEPGLPACDPMPSGGGPCPP